MHGFLQELRWTKAGRWAWEMALLGRGWELLDYGVVERAKSQVRLAYDQNSGMTDGYEACLYCRGWLAGLE